MSPVDVLAIGAHPDDVELGCGATVARLARAGRRVGILHLTRGEAGSRGTPEERRREAERAAAILGAAELVMAAFPPLAQAADHPLGQAVVAWGLGLGPLWAELGSPE